MIKTTFALLLSLALMVTNVAAGPLLYITNPVSDTVTVVDLTTTTANVVAVGRNPVYAAATPDGRRVYVVNRGNQVPTNQGSISVIDTSTNMNVAEISLGIGFPFQIAMTPDGSRAYVAVSQASGDVTSESPNRVAVINTRTNTLETSIPIPGDDPYGPIGVAITPDGNRAYVTNRGNGTVEVIETSTNTWVETIPVSSSFPVGIAITPDGTRAYVVTRGPLTRVLMIGIDPNLPGFHSVVDVIQIDINPSSSVTSIAITPDGRRAYVTYGSNRVAVIDVDPGSANFNRVMTTINTMAGALNVLVFTPDGNQAYVASSNPNRVVILDTDPASRNFNKVVGEIPLGPTDAFGLAIVPSR